MDKKRIAVIRIKGIISIKRSIADTLRLMRIYNKNYCVIIDNSKYSVGMLEKVKDYVTWGELDQKTFKELLEKRGKLAGNKRLTAEYLKEKTKTDFDAFTKEFFEFKKQLKDVPGLKQFFRLAPPRKGFERKGIKIPFSLGGALGYRKDKINDLLLRMI